MLKLFEGRGMPEHKPIPYRYSVCSLLQKDNLPLDWNKAGFSEDLKVLLPLTLPGSGLRARLEMFDRLECVQN